MLVRQICFITLFAFGGAGAPPNDNSPQVLTVDASVPTPLNSEYVWTKLLDSAAWKKSYNYQMFSQRDTAWVFHPDGNWFSINGTTWTKSALPNAIFNLAFLDYIQFKNAMYGIGHLEGNIEQYKITPEIYRTTDFQHWQTLTKESNLPQRFFYHPFVFNDQLWIIGGEDSHGQYADVWTSPDAVTWTKQKDGLPFGRRSNSQVVNLNGQLFLLNNDVWTSADGLNWGKVTDEIMKGEEVYGYTALVYDQHIWLLGCNRNGQSTSQILSSADGRQWEEHRAPWSPRGGLAAAVHQGKIYMTGGKYSTQPNAAYSNDLWALEKK